MIKALIIDIDGVLTDGKVYISKNMEFKTLCYQDLDALNEIKKADIKTGIITGEDNEFTEFLRGKINPDYFYSGCKDKGKAVLDIIQKSGIEKQDIWYIGDGKYDLSAMKEAGVSICPANAIAEIRQNANIILKSKGGTGCIAEINDLLHKNAPCKNKIRECIFAHKKIIEALLADESCISMLTQVAVEIVRCYENGNKLLLCGNGGSAADAQHLAAELVSKFYMKRKALSAQALNTNTSVITAIGNDFDFTYIFSRSVEAQGCPGDILIGISTSGRSNNIIEAFKTAKKMDIITVLLTGMIDEKEEILDCSDYVLSVPSRDTPRVQEAHILMGHIICEIVERNIFGSEEIKNEP